MTKFSQALTEAIEATGLSLSEIAATGNLSSHSIVSRLKKGNMGCTPATFECVVNAFEGHPQQQLNLIIGRCKDSIPERFRKQLDSINWTTEGETLSYSPDATEWDKAIEKISRVGHHNEELRSTILFLASVTPD